MEYQFIVNPLTNRKCRVDSRLGRQIIKNYIQLGGTNGGEHEDHDPNQPPQEPLINDQYQGEDN